VNAEERHSAIATEPHPVWSGVDGLDDPVREVFDHAPLYDVERLIAFVLSRSQTILTDAGEREAMLEDIRANVPGGEFALPLVCEAWRGARR